MYKQVYQRSTGDPDGFWGDAATAIDWTRPPTRVLDRSREPFFRWYPDGELNTCHNAVDRHVDAGRGDQPALIYDSPVTGTVRTYTYRELRDQVARFAGALRRLGVGRGDRVVVYLPMVPEAVIAMLACARLGAVHSVVFGGFAAHELAVRIDDAKPVVVVSASGGIEPTRVVRYKPLLDAAIEESTHKPRHCVILQRPQCSADLLPGRDVDWADAVATAEPVGCVPVAATDPLYILYTSGTTGRPKGVVRDNGGHAVALRWSMANIFDTAPGEVYWAASDVGWVVGHSYIVYAPLLTGATTVLYEGKPVGTPDAGAFWRVVEDHRVTTMFTAPTALRAIKKEDPDGTLVGSSHHAAAPVSRGRAAGPGDLPLGGRQAGCAGDRQLVADRDRLADRGQPARARPDADETRVAERTSARVRRARGRPGRRRGTGRHRRRDRDPAAVATRLPAHAVGRRRAVRAPPT